MKNKKGILTSLLAAVLLLITACGGGGGGSSPSPNPNPNPNPGGGGDILSSLTGSPVTSFPQSIVSQDTGTPYDEVFPGQANIWTLEQDFTIIDGFDNQFFYAESLTVGQTPFPSDQVYSELTFTGPVLGLSDGIKVAAVSDGKTVWSPLINSSIATQLSGTYAAFLNATPDSRLTQTIDLTSAPSGLISLTWQDAVFVDPGTIPGYDPKYQVVIRKTDGTLLTTTPLYSNPTSQLWKQHLGTALNQYAGQVIVLSFEESSSTTPWGQAYAIIDAVSIKDANGHEYVTNGSFETGDLTGWNTNSPTFSQNVTSGARTLEGLKVTRSFFTRPNKLWGRWVDLFENTTSSSITTTIIYETNLGSSGGGVIYSTPGTNSKALTSWDATNGGRDLGLAFGTVQGMSLISLSSDTTNGITSGDPVITISFVVTVPAGSKKAIVNFVIMDGKDTGLSATSSTDPSTGVTTIDTTLKATDIDNEAANIVANFWTDAQYLEGMTQEQIQAIVNF